MGVLAQLRERSGGARARVARDLRALYLDARRLGTQLRRHSDRVPYPALTPELRHLADQADGHAATLAAELHALAGNADPSDIEVPREGRNHWERLTITLADLESLQRRATELALRADVDFPSTAGALARLARAASVMRVTVRGMIARSDPHAGS